MTSRSPEAAPLFRPEALAEREAPWLGRVLLAPPLSHSLLAGAALLIVAGLAALLAFGEYTRSARLDGWLAPREGPPGAAPAIEALFVASSAEAAPLRPGLPARLRGDGGTVTHTGVLRAVTPILPDPEAASRGSLPLPEPAFLVAVSLPEGTPRLRAGLTIQAEIPLETRRLYEWVLGDG